MCVCWWGGVWEKEKEEGGQVCEGCAMPGRGDKRENFGHRYNVRLACAETDQSTDQAPFKFILHARILHSAKYTACVLLCI